VRRVKTLRHHIQPTNQKRTLSGHSPNAAEYTWIRSSGGPKKKTEEKSQSHPVSGKEKAKPDCIGERRASP
jgi:hypothetical protein